MCVEVWPNTSSAISAGYPERNSKEGDKVNFEELYNNGRDNIEMSLFCSQFD